MQAVHQTRTDNQKTIYIMGETLVAFSFFMPGMEFPRKICLWDIYIQSWTGKRSLLLFSITYT